MSYALTPDHYTCNLHGTDLTAAVEEKVNQLPEPTARWGFGSGRGRKKSANNKPFTVEVACSGSNGDDRHEVYFDGTYSDS